MNEALAILKNFLIVAGLGVLGGVFTWFIVTLAVSALSNKPVNRSQIKRTGRR